MNRRYKTLLKQVKASCPHCEQKLMSIYSGNRPFKPTSPEILIQTKCVRCGKEVEFILDNMKN